MKAFSPAIVAMLAAVIGSGSAPAAPAAPDSLVAPAEADTLTDVELAIFPPEGITPPYSYQIDWGDGETLDWTEPLRIAYEAYRSHRYARLGEFDIRVRVRDSLNRVSDWGRPITVQVGESRLKWRFETFDPVVAPPALDENGNIYIGDESGWFYSIDPTGILRWGFETGDAIYGAAALSGNRVYFGSLDSHLYCLDRDRGRQNWKRRFQEEVFTAPAVDARGNLYLAANGSELVAVSSRNRVPWRFDTGEEILGSPSIGPDGSIFVASDSLYCLDDKGRRRWAFGPGEDGFLLASPVLDREGNVYIGSSEGRVYAVGPDGVGLWQLTLPNEDEIMAELAAGPDGAFWFGGDGGYLFRLDPPVSDRGPRVRPVLETLDVITGTAAISDKGTVYILADDGYLYAVRADGRPAWRYEIAAGDKEILYTSSPVIGPDGTVYVGSWDGGVYAFRGDGPPARTFWSQYRQDAKNSGRVDR